MSVIEEAPLAVPPKKRWANLGSRISSALVLIAVAMAPLYFGGWAWAGLAAIFGLRIIYEWVRMSDGKDSALAFIIPMAACLASITLMMLGHILAAWSVIVVAAILAFIERARRSASGGPFWAGLGALYMLVPTLCLVTLRGGGTGFEAQGLQIILFIMLVVIVADTMAYVGGSIMGGPKLAPKISPKKTWSGFLTGFVFSLFLGAGAAAILKFPISNGVALAAGVAILSVIGDLVESACKRKLGVKDAGRLIPGHGGLLDRFDSLMMSAVFAALALYVMPELWPGMSLS